MHRRINLNFRFNLFVKDLEMSLDSILKMEQRKDTNLKTRTVHFRDRGERGTTSRYCLYLSL